MDDHTWVRVGVLIDRTIGEPEVRVYTSVFPSLTTKEVATVLDLLDPNATHAE